MKELWIRVDGSLPENAKNEFLKSAAQVCDVIEVGVRDVEQAKKMGAKTAAGSGDCDIFVLESVDEGKLSELKKNGRTVAIRARVKHGRDEEAVIRAVDFSVDYIILDCPNWKVIPLENLIAKTRGKSKLLAEVSNAEDAKLALETLELGADGVLLKTSDLDELAKTAIVVKKHAPKLMLTPAKVVEMKQIGIGARVCVDTCDLMQPGEGILAACQSSGLFLVQAEVLQNPFVETRPFRVNAGPVSLYTLTSSSKTRYLSELKAGDEILIVNRDGQVRVTCIARVKIEWRPMILIEAEHNGRRIKTIVQNAETVQLITSDGSRSIVELKPGDEVLVHITEGGRHFGTLVEDEKVIER